MARSRELITFRTYLQEALALAKEGEGELAILYEEVANDVKAKMRAHNDQTTAVELEKDIDEAFRKVATKRIKIIKTRIEAAGKLGPKASTKTLKRAFGDELSSASVRTSKRAAQVAANRIAGRTRVDGASVSKRLRTLDKDVSGEMAREVEKGIRQKKGILGAARRIEKLDPRDVRLPKYIEQVRDAAKAGNVDALKKVTARYAKYVDGLGEIQPDLTKRASKYSLRSATKRFMKRIEKAGPAGVDALVDRYVKERAAFRANTIARHETVEAFRRSYIEQNKNKPGVYGMKWILSPTRHKVADECDVYANQNAYGLGPGVYPVDKVPTNPHPNCICSVVVALDRKHFQRQGADNDNALPEELRDNKSPDALAWLKGNDAAAAQILGPTRHRMLKEGVNVLDAEGKPLRVRDLLGRTAEPKKIAVGQSYLPPQASKKPKAPPKLAPVPKAPKPKKAPPRTPAAAAPPPPPPPPSTPPPPPPPPSTPPPPKPPKPPKVPEVPKLPPMEPLPAPTSPQQAAEPPFSSEAARARIDAIRERVRKSMRGPFDLAAKDVPSTLDRMMSDAGLSGAADSWSGGVTFAGWHHDSTDTNAAIGQWIFRNFDEGRDLPALKKLAMELGYHGDPKNFLHYAQEQYAMTQEALLKRLADGTLSGVDQNGYVTLYRGIAGGELTDAAKAGLPVASRPLASWTGSKSSAANFAGYGGVILEKRVHISRVFSQFEHSRIARTLMPDEDEWILVFPEEQVIIDKWHNP